MLMRMARFLSVTRSLPIPNASSLFNSECWTRMRRTKLDFLSLAERYLVTEYLLWLSFNRKYFKQENILGVRCWLGQKTEAADSVPGHDWTKL